VTFVTLEDETGVANLIIRLDVWERFRSIATTAVALIAHGRLERQGETIHILVGKLEALPSLLDSQSRDFR
jgi:error-prone DNA polymerase